MLRLNYMASVFWASVGLLLLLVYPYSDRLLSPLVLLTALPYFVAMSGDLKSCGYKRTDVFRIYGFNLILLPVNLSGSLRSLSQAVTGKKIAFARTPKVRNRTTAPILFVLFPFVLIAFSLFTVYRDIQFGNWAHAAFASFNAVAALWALVALVGIRNAGVDVVVNVIDRLYRRERPARYKRRRTPVPEAASPIGARCSTSAPTSIRRSSSRPALLRRSRERTTKHRSTIWPAAWRSCWARRPVRACARYGSTSGRRGGHLGERHLVGQFVGPLVGSRDRSAGGGNNTVNPGGIRRSFHCLRRATPSSKYDSHSVANATGSGSTSPLSRSGSPGSSTSRRRRRPAPSARRGCPVRPRDRRAAG